MAGWNTIYRSTSTSLRNHMNAMTKLQNQASSGKRIRHASDSPSDAYHILSLVDTVTSLTAYQDNLAMVEDNLLQADTILQRMSNQLSDMEVVFQQVLSGTYNAENREQAAVQINGMLEEAVMAANSEYMGRYIFGGGDISQTPYEVIKTDGEITSVEYRGEPDDLTVPIAPGIRYPSMLVGDRFFRNDRRQPPVITGATGAIPGSGTSSMRGDAPLDVTHSATVTIGPPLGLAIGASSNTGDTLIGSGTITIDEPAGTIRFGSGPTQTIGSADLKLEDENGRVVYVDTSAIPGGTAGAVTLSGSGTLSINGGVDTIPISFADNEAVTDSATGRVLYVDSSAITQAGTNTVQVPGTFDIFGLMISLRDTLKQARTLSANEHIAKLIPYADALSEVKVSVVRQTTSVGARLQALDSIKTTLDNVAYNAETQRSRIQDADVVQISVELAKSQTLYEMTLASAAKLLNMSLLDYIR